MIQKISLVLKFLIIAACIGVYGAPVAFAFKDVLDTPAFKTKSPHKYLYNGMAWAGKRLFSVGRYGIIVYSDDNGRSWVQAEEVPVSSDLTAVYFPTPEKGWAVGHDGVVLHTMDGGITWIKQMDGRDIPGLMAKFRPEDTQLQATGSYMPMGPDMSFLDIGPVHPFLDVYFENESTGFVVGAFNLIFRTTDGGKTWKPWFDRTENPMFLHMYSFGSIGGDLYVAGEMGLVMKLDRKAERFRRIETPYEGTFFGITGKDGTIVVFGMLGKVFRSDDKGISWQKIETGVEGGLTGSTVMEDGRIVLVSQGGEILASKNDCRDFDKIILKIPFSAASVLSVGQDTVVLAGFGGMRLEKLR